KERERGGGGALAIPENYRASPTPRTRPRSESVHNRNKEYPMGLFSRKTPPATRRANLAMEQLETRMVPATQAFFAGGVLAVFGDAANNNILVAADANGKLQVTDNGVAVNIQVFGNTPATNAQTGLIFIDGGAGNDVITTDKSLNVLDANGKLASSPSAIVFGGDGNDVVTLGQGGFLGGVV